MTEIETNYSMDANPPKRTHVAPQRVTMLPRSKRSTVWGVIHPYE